MIGQGKIRPRSRWFFFRVFLCLLFSFGLTRLDLAADKKTLQQLLPTLTDWLLCGEPDFYGPENLFEYINGASESYLAYDFKGLLVAQYSRKKDAEPVLTVEIYDMGRSENAFGIYSSERPTEGNFLPVGVEGYLEQGALQFFHGRYYTKVLCFLEGNEADTAALLFSREVSKRIPEDKTWPRVLTLFPVADRIPHSEKFILNNFLGFSYLRQGYLCGYQKEGIPFEVFIVPAKDAPEAENLVSRLAQDFSDAQAESRVIDGIWHVKSKYFQNIYLTKQNSFILGLIRLPEGRDELALEFLRNLSLSITRLKEAQERP